MWGWVLGLLAAASLGCAAESLAAEVDTDAAATSTTGPAGPGGAGGSTASTSSTGGSAPAAGAGGTARVHECTPGQGELCTGLAQCQGLRACSIDFRWGDCVCNPVVPDAAPDPGPDAGAPEAATPATDAPPAAIDAGRDSNPTWCHVGLATCDQYYGAIHGYCCDTCVGQQLCLGCNSVDGSCHPCPPGWLDCDGLPGCETFVGQGNEGGGCPRG